jgi:hypothetical protein
MISGIFISHSFNKIVVGSVLFFLGSIFQFVLFVILQKPTKKIEETQWKDAIESYFRTHRVVIRTINIISFLFLTTGLILFTLTLRLFGSIAYTIAGSLFLVPYLDNYRKYN